MNMPIKFFSEAIFSGLGFFNEPEISDLGPPAWSPSWRTCAQDFYILKKFSAGFEPANLGSWGEHIIPRPPTLNQCMVTSTCLMWFGVLKKKEQWKKLMSVRDSLDGFAKDKFKLNLKKNPDVETFATLTEFPLRLLTRYVPLVSIDFEQFLSI